MRTLQASFGVALLGILFLGCASPKGEVEFSPFRAKHEPGFQQRIEAWLKATHRSGFPSSDPFELASSESKATSTKCSADGQCQFLGIEEWHILDRRYEYIYVLRLATTAMDQPIKIEFASEKPEPLVIRRLEQDGQLPSEVKGQGESFMKSLLKH